ncbi:MAG: hypothetical protein IT385_17050, partial [Deltaproteobacteria bacterium]|nr:hypothetical protein [Deltaproteobacteria bacterium]
AAVDASVRAAEVALAALAYEDAIALVQRALERAQHDRRARAELLLAEGLARARADDARRGAALCAQAAELARALGDPALFARAALGYGADFTFGSTDRVLVRLLEEALAGLPADNVTLRAHVLSRLAAALQPAADPAVPVRMAREAIALARGLDDERARLVVTHAAMSALVDFVPADQRIAHDLEVERLALAAGDRPRVMRARARLTFDHLELAAIEAAEASFEGYTRLAAELRWGRALWHAPLFRSMRAALEGRFSQTGPALAEASAMAEEGGDPTRRWVLAMHRFGLYRTAERHDALLGLEPELRAAFGPAPPAETWCVVTRAGILARVGRWEEARAALARGDRQTMLAQSDLVTLGVAAAVAAATRDAPLAAALYERLAPLSGRLMAYGIMAVFCEGPYDRPLALLASALGRHDEVERHFEAAAATCRRLGLAPHLARTLHEQALALAPRDPARAAALASEALSIARTLDMVGLVAAIERAAVTAGPAASPLTARPVVMARAGADWVVRWGGSELRLKDSRGLQILHRLVAEPEREIHALELAGRLDDGDAGEHLDRVARERYRARLADLDEAVREAEANGDAERAARARAEIEVIAGELARAVGLGGRDRRSASASERARVAVQKRIKDALRRIEEEAPELARALAGSIRTGVTCCYHPGGRPP